MAGQNDSRLASMLEKFKALQTELEKFYSSSAKPDAIPEVEQFKLTNGGTAGEDLLPSPSVESTEQAAVANRALILHNRSDPKSGDRADFLPDGSKFETKIERETTSYAFRLRKNTYPTGSEELSDSEIEIFGQELCQLLKQALPDTCPSWESGESISVDSPFPFIIRNWDTLAEESDKLDADENDSTYLGDKIADRQAREDLKLLLDTIQEGSGDPKLDEFLEKRESLRKSNSVTFDALWTVFTQGQLVYHRQFLYKKGQLFVVRSFPTFWPSKDTRKPWTINCYAYDFNGQTFARHRVVLKIERFAGSTRVDSLLVHPLDQNEKAVEVKATLKARGKAFRKICITPKSSCMFEYTGDAMFVRKGLRGLGDDKDAEDDETMVERTEIQPSRDVAVSSNVIVDFESYYRYGASQARLGNVAIDPDLVECDCHICLSQVKQVERSRRRFDGKTGHEADWEEEQLMMLPPRVVGYVLREKQWAHFDVDKIKNIEVEGRDAAFKNDLKLKGKDFGLKQKNLLMGLIKEHGNKESSDGRGAYGLKDIVIEKGKGLVMLLYGPPGVGKTSTAQTIAKAAGRPLFSIGVADVGIDAKHVERNLDKIFNLSSSWGAILLIDEADVFLQSRTTGHEGPTTERNALVSVFLRVLEYYQGIMILTTNQIATFDIAVQSRIHIALRYHGLEEEQTTAIFMGFCRQYKTQALIAEEEFQKIHEWAASELYRLEFDGRQLRNLATSAMGLARSQNPPCQMTLTHLKDVVEIMESFKKDLGYQMMKYKEQQSQGFSR